jgi:hypothetical protein
VFDTARIAVEQSPVLSKHLRSTAPLSCAKRRTRPTRLSRPRLASSTG